MQIVMQLSENMKKVQHYTDEQFISWLMYIRYDNIAKYERHYLFKMINDRCDKLGITFEFGCCGTNIINRRENV